MTAIFKRFFAKEKPLDTMAKEEDVRLVIGQDVLSLGTIVLDKEFFGNFYAQEQVIVGPKACVAGNIITTSCTVKGKVFGNITCMEELIIQETAVVEGSISAKNAKIAPGALIKASLNLNAKLHVSLLSEKLKLLHQLEEQPSDPIAQRDVPSAAGSETIIKKEEPKINAKANNQEGSWW